LRARHLLEQPTSNSNRLRPWYCRVVLRFRVGPIPVLVHFSHVLISGLLAWSFAQGPAEAGWPGDILAHPSDPMYRVTFAVVIALWMAIISGTVLLQELARALTSRTLGYQAVIRLGGLGGSTQMTATPEVQNPAMPWHHELFILISGPAAGLGLGLFIGVCLVAANAVGSLPHGLEYVLKGVCFTNLFWSLLNLVPVAPLNGGAIARVLLMRFFGRVGFLMTQILALVVASLAVVAVAVAQPILALLFSLYCFRAIWQINAYRRGELPLGPAAHPASAQLTLAETVAAQGKLDEAERLARSVLASNAPVALSARAHAVLGWVFVKRGDGPKALEHFALADPSLLPPHAVAAAHSLAGDETSALPLWERASAGGDAVIRHEYAGALIRAGREPEARRLPDLRLSLAFAAAERVHFLRREYAQAAAMAEASFREEPSLAAAYDAACAWALANNPEAAMRCLTLAAQNGFHDAAAVRTDPDLRSLRGSPEFEAWVAGLAPVTPG